MAAFMHRLAEVRVVDAATLNGQAGTAYTTKVWSASCGSKGESLTDLESTCLPETDATIDPSTSVEVLSIEPATPTTGSLQLSSTALPGDIATFAFTIDQACPADRLGYFVQAVNGHPWASDGEASVSVHMAISIGDGLHTVRLCALNNDPSIAMGLPAATLTAVWTPGGEISVAAADTSPVDAPWGWDG